MIPSMSKQQGNWPARLRWFGAEFLVVVTGVLVALAFNAWWGTREEIRREEDYLRQILAELTRTEAELTEEIRFSEGLFAKAARLHAAFFDTAPPSSDSLNRWLELDHADPEPVLGTLRAIVSTGQLNIVRDDSLRASLVWLNERAAYYDHRFRRWEGMVVGTFERLQPHSFVARTVGWHASGRPPLPPPPTRTWSEAMPHLSDEIRPPAFAGPTTDFLQDPRVYDAAVAYMIGQRNHRRNMERLLDDVRATRSVVEAAL